MNSTNGIWPQIRGWRCVFRRNRCLIRVKTAGDVGHAGCSRAGKAVERSVIESDGRSFAVETHYRPARDANERLVPHVCRVIGEALRDTEGDILVFLPGAGEITRVQDSLIESTRDIRITPLHGQLNDKEQKQALNPDYNGQRKVILATNIAESSVTIDGVRVVIDCGLKNIAFAQHSVCRSW